MNKKYNKGSENISYGRLSDIINSTLRLQDESSERMNEIAITDYDSYYYDNEDFEF